MGSYLITHSLLSSWLYLMKENPFEDAESTRDDMAEFLKVLRREPTETTEAMQKGIDFEDLVTEYAFGGYYDQEHKWYDAANKVASRVRGGVFQYKASKTVRIGDMDILLYGRLDVLKAGEVIDIKFSSSYERGKFFDSTQHPMYLELIPEADRFTYIISNGTDVWEETYRREETQDIKYIVSDFIEWLKVNSLLDTFKEFWSSR